MKITETKIDLSTVKSKILEMANLMFIYKPLTIYLPSLSGMETRVKFSAK